MKNLFKRNNTRNKVATFEKYLWEEQSKLEKRIAQTTDEGLKEILWDEVFDLMEIRKKYEEIMEI